MDDMNGDQAWINHRLSEYSRCHTIEHIQAAIARGREQGRAEVMPEVERLRREAADEYRDVMAPLVDMLGKAVQDTHFAWSGHALDAARALIAERDRLREDVRREREHARAFSADIKQALMERAEKAEADRDRLAKRVQELEADIAGADEFLRSTVWENPAGATTVEARVRLAYEAGVNDGAHNEAMVVRSLESRLAATDARLTALVDALHSWFREERGGDYDTTLGEFCSRLAALRAPGESAIGAIVDALVTDQNAEVAELTRALATARRERDEAVGVVRDWIGVRDQWEIPDSGMFSPVVARARALVAGEADLSSDALCCCGHTLAAHQGHTVVAGQPEPTHCAECRSCRSFAEAPKPTPIRRYCAKHAVGSVDGCGQCKDERIAARDAERDTLRARDAEITGLKAKLAGAEHAIADLTTTFGTVESDRGVLAALLDEAARLIERFMGPWADASHHEHLDEIERDAEVWLAARGKP